MFSYDCIIVGSGHAGVEAALAVSRMGCRALMVNLSFDTIGQMSCNPAIGGVGKGQLVKEIDALGGEMGLAADCTGIQFRQLNASKGKAVRSSRCQSDRNRYKIYMQRKVHQQENLDFLQGKVGEILVANGKVVGVKTEEDVEIKAPTVVVATGTFLKARMHIGSKIISAGRIGEPNSTRLADNIRDLGFDLMFFKTGTPPRLDGRTIDFSSLEKQYSDNPPVPFSFRTKEIPKEQQLLPCYITHTNEQTHAIIRKNMHLSPMYSGQIQATGVRYCPSIEDKLKKFGEKTSHQVFLEPDGLDTDEYYPNGISTGLPAEIQEEFVRSIKGLENVKIDCFGYSIEHGVISSMKLKASLETKSIGGLFFAGQVNGTTGYEEAAAQGLIAGINAGLYVQNKEPFILGRDEAYIGVLIDDLITKGTEEPYRMFTSRVEYRLIVREDNADIRLGKYGHALGILSEEDYRNIQKKQELIQETMDYLRQVRKAPQSDLDQGLIKEKESSLRAPTLLSDILKRPRVSYQWLALFDERLSQTSKEVAEQVEYEIKYEGFIKRQLKDIERFKHIEKIKIPETINYDCIPGLSIEIRQKLKKFMPATVGQANRISGVTPAAVSILMVYLRKTTLEGA